MRKAQPVTAFLTGVAAPLTVIADLQIAERRHNRYQLSDRARRAAAEFVALL